MPGKPGQHATIPPRPYLREEVYSVLRRHVTQLADATSTVISLREADLARSIGVSRTPVREALSRLHQEGLVEVVPRRGAQVLPTTLDEYLCWLEIREVLEGLAARHAAERIAPEQIDELRALFASDNEADYGPTDFAEANATFHAALIGASGKALLTRLSRTYDHFRGARLRITARLGRIEQSVREHREILDALARRDGEAAERLARQHVRKVREAAARELVALEP